MAVLRRLARNLGVHLQLRDPPNVPPFGWSYFDHIVALYLTLNAGDARADAVIKKASDTPDALTWGDIFLLENVIFTLQPPEILERTTWMMRERLRLTACATVYDKYIQSAPPPRDTPKLALLRADLTRVLDLLHWHYSLIPIRERMRKSLTVSCIWLTLTYTLALGLALFWFRKHGWDSAAMMIGVLYCGIVGGFVSSLRRMQSISSDTDPLISIFGLDSAGYFLWLSPLLGAIFAVVLMCMFVAGMLKGTIFPEFFSEVNKNGGLPFFRFMTTTLPTGTEQYAKLFVWAFLAGFAERLVPDSLDRLTKMGSDKGPGGPPPPPPSNGPTILPPRPPEKDVEDKPVVAEQALENALHTGVISPDPLPESGHSD